MKVVVSFLALFAVFSLNAMDQVGAAASLKKRVSWAASRDDSELAALRDAILEFIVRFDDENLTQQRLQMVIDMLNKKSMLIDVQFVGFYCHSQEAKSFSMFDWVRIQIETLLNDSENDHTKGKPFWSVEAGVLQRWIVIKNLLQEHANKHDILIPANYRELDAKLKNGRPSVKDLYFSVHEQKMLIIGGLFVIGLACLAWTRYQK